jgi:hypothetical protein
MSGTHNCRYKTRNKKIKWLVGLFLTVATFSVTLNAVQVTHASDLYAEAFHKGRVFQDDCLLDLEEATEKKLPRRFALARMCGVSRPQHE